MFFPFYSGYLNAPMKKQTNNKKPQSKQQPKHDPLRTPFRSENTQKKSEKLNDYLQCRPGLQTCIITFAFAPVRQQDIHSHTVAVHCMLPPVGLKETISFTEREGSAPKLYPQNLPSAEVLIFFLGCLYCQGKKQTNQTSNSITFNIKKKKLLCLSIHRTERIQIYRPQTLN